MNTHDPAVETIFNAAKALPEASRGDYLNLACKEDAALRQEVERLLAASASADKLFEERPVGLTLQENTVLDSTVREGPGTRIGRYKLLQQIGEGGMGVVYMAEQEEPVRRRVALKIIKLGMDTQQVVARFEAERQALALMDHPNIARVFDGGTTEGGRPYFVMELVQGVPIIEFCDKSRLSARDRLDLFLQVCEAVQSAHQKGIIHRDLKPSNILVTQHHGKPMPKVIDFGIAKATNQKLTEKTLFTQHATMIGTPAYMSPEQAEMSSMDVDTRSDIYSLGVLLYELLTGTTPFPEKRLRSLGYGEMQRVIADEEPERPSTRLSTLADEQKTVVAKNRGADLAALSRRLRGDLDWVVMKCLEKDRRRRYETANGLAADIRRHLNNEPVTARPPSAAYKFQRAWRRNKVIFAAGAAVVLALLAGVIGTTAGLVRAERQRRAAQAAQHEERRQRELADKALDGEKAQRSQADATREELQATAYANAINLVQKAVADQNLALAWDLLNQQRPAPGRPDRRGWEWRYLWQQCQSDASSSPVVLPHRYNKLTVSPDGKLLVATINGGSAVLEIPEPHQLRVIEPFVGSSEIFRAVFSPDGGLLATETNIHVPGADNDRQVLRLLDTRTWKIVAETALPELAQGLFFSSEGETLLSVLPGANETEQLALWRVPTLERITNSPGFRVPSGGLGDRADKWRIEVAAPADLSALAILKNGPNPSVRVIDTITGKERWHVGGAVVVRQQFSPDGRLLLISEGMAVEPRVRIFDAHSGQELGPGLTEHREWVSSLVFWPDGKMLATASADQTIRLWDLSDPSRPKAIGRPLQGHKAEVWGLALLPDQRTLVSTDKEGTFLTWDTQRARTDRTRLTLNNTNSWDSYRFGPDGKTIFAVEAKGAVVRLSGSDFEVRDEVAHVGKPFFGAVLSRDCRFLACGFTNGLVQLWDLNWRTRVKEFSVGSSPVKPFQFRGDGKSLIVLYGPDLPAREWDLATFRERGSWQDLGGPSCLSPDERWFFSFGEGEESNSFLSRDMVTGLRTVQTNTPSKVENITHLATSPDGNLLVASSEKGYARILDRATLRPLGKPLSGFLVQSVFSSCFSPDGKRLATASGGREALRLWDVDRHQLLVALAASRHSLFTDVQFSPDGNTLGALSANEDSIHLWRAPSWEEIEKAEASAGESQKP